MENQTPDHRTERAARYADAYERGIYTLDEAASQVMECITSENAGYLLNTLPAPIRQQLIASANDAPTTDESWVAAEFVKIAPGCTTANRVPPTEAEMRASMERWKAQYRMQIEAIRECMS